MAQLILLVRLAIGLSMALNWAQFTMASPDYFRSQELDLIPSFHIPNDLIEQNSSLGIDSALGCGYCGGNDVFFSEPPPDGILYIPSPPLHPSFILSDINSLSKQQEGDQCNFCNEFHRETLQGVGGQTGDFNNRLVVVLIAFISIAVALCLYLIGSRKSRIISSLTQTTIFKSSPTANVVHTIGKNDLSSNSLVNSGVHLSDPCYLQTNRDKNLTNPIISDHAPHKKTAIPSKYWAQQGSIINRTIRRVPNEYEVPSSQTNSTGTSSAVYADMNNEQNNQRFFSPYNLHTYAEVREVLDPNEHFHTNSNSSAMLSDSNYDNNVYPHNSGPGCLMNNAPIMNAAHQGSVQMSDFNSLRNATANPMVSYNSHTMAHQMNTHQAHQNQHHQMLNHQLTKMHHNNNNPQHLQQQPIYEQPASQRAQVIITSNNQGVNPTLLNYRDRVHNVI